jgi:AraC-like DNA-binding protein
MDKTDIIYDKKQQPVIEVHTLPKGMREIHGDYGLWICRYSLNGKSPSRISFPPRYFEFYCISHLIEGRGCYRAADGSTRIMEPGDAVIVSPKYVHCYGGFKDSYVEDTINFCGRVADSFLRCGIIRNGVVKAGTARRLKPIIELAIDPAKDSQIQANIALEKLLVSLYVERQDSRTGEKYSYLRTLLAEIQASPGKWWSIDEMAEFCNLSEMQFRRVFKAHTGMGPKDYVDGLKIQTASEKILSSDDKISKIAESLGYLDPFHFSRRFRQITGLSPREFRRNSQGVSVRG